MREGIREVTFCFLRDAFPLESEEMNGIDTNADGRTKKEKRPSRLVLLARRWDDVASRARKEGWTQSQIKMSKLAKLVRWKWHSTYAHALLSEYLAYDGTALTKARYIGPSIIHSLCIILERSLEMKAGGNRILNGEIMGEVPDPRQTLADWRVPLDLPCRFMILPERLQRICSKEWNVRDLEDLLEFVEANGFGVILKSRNLGRKTVAILEQFVNALKDGNRVMASKVLPLDDSGKGLSLSKALQAQLNRSSPGIRQILDICLGDGLSNSACAERVGRTTAFVGIVKKDFLQAARAWLEWFGCHDVEDALAKLQPSDSSPESEMIAMAVHLALEKRGNNRHSAIFGMSPRDL